VAGRSVSVLTSRETGLDVATAAIQISAGTTAEATFTFRTPSDGKAPRRLTLLPDQRPASETLCR